MSENFTSGKQKYVITKAFSAKSVVEQCVVFWLFFTEHMHSKPLTTHREILFFTFSRQSLSEANLYLAIKPLSFLVLQKRCPSINISYEIGEFYFLNILKAEISFFKIVKPKLVLKPE